MLRKQYGIRDDKAGVPWRNKALVDRIDGSGCPGGGSEWTFLVLTSTKRRRCSPTLNVIAAESVRKQITEDEALYIIPVRNDNHQFAVKLRKKLAACTAWKWQLRPFCVHGQDFKIPTPGRHCSNCSRSFRAKTYTVRCVFHIATGEQLPIPYARQRTPHSIAEYGA